MILSIFDRVNAAVLLRRKPLDEILVSAAMLARTLATFGEDLAPDGVVRRVLRDTQNLEGSLSHKWLPQHGWLRRDHRLGR